MEFAVSRPESAPLPRCPDRAGRSRSPVLVPVMPVLRPQRHERGMCGRSSWRISSAMSPTVATIHLSTYIASRVGCRFPYPAAVRAEGMPGSHVRPSIRPQVWAKKCGCHAPQEWKESRRARSRPLIPAVNGCGGRCSARKRSLWRRGARLRRVGMLGAAMVDGRKRGFLEQRRDDRHKRCG